MSTEHNELIPGHKMIMLGEDIMMDCQDLGVWSLQIYVNIFKWTRKLSLSIETVEVIVKSL